MYSICEKSKYDCLYYRRDSEINNLNSRLEDEQSQVSALKRKIKELEVS